MISCDTSKLEADLKKFQEEAVRKLQGMVEIFTYNITVEAIDNTPMGEITEPSAGSAGTRWMYELLSRRRVLPVEAGSAKGGWTVSMNSPTRIIFPDRAKDRGASNIKDNADIATQAYKLGDVVYIMNSVRYVATEGWTLPKFGSLENGYSSQAPNGIMQPTLDSILSVYSMNLKKYYEDS